MATLKEMLAAKKAAALGLIPVTAAQANGNVVIDVGPSPTDAMIQKQTSQEDLDRVRDAAISKSMQEKPDLLAAMGLTSIIEVPVKAEPAPPPKTMTFAEKMALKRKEVEAKNEIQTGQLLQQETSSEQKPVEVIKLSKEQEENLIEIEDSEMAQAYSDIALKINYLSTTSSGESLGNAMADLKKALHKNPSASMMLLDTDIGQMTIALRRYTHVELAESAEAKGEKKAAKKYGKATNIVLTPELLALQFSDL